MTEPIRLYDVVALTDDVPTENLIRGQVGTIVMEHAPGVYEVEFCDNDGHTYGLLALKAEQLMVLHHQQLHA